MIRTGFFVLILFSCIAYSEPEPEVYLYSFFQDNGEEGLHLAYSEGALHWTALNENQSYLTPTAGADKLMRDPCIIRRY